MLDPEELAKYEGHTPTTLDYLATYRDGVDKMEFVLSSAGASAGTRPVVYTVGNTESDLSSGSAVYGAKA